MKSNLEKTFSLLMLGSGIRSPIREFVFAEPRKWRFDFCWPFSKLAVEIEGGIWVQGAHNRGAHFIGDCDKYNEAARRGWKVLRFTSNHLEERPLEVIDLVRGMLLLKN